jgi:hypothetical protein
MAQKNCEARRSVIRQMVAEGTNFNPPFYRELAQKFGVSETAIRNDVRLFAPRDWRPGQPLKAQSGIFSASQDCDGKMKGPASSS